MDIASCPWDDTGDWWVFAHEMGVTVPPGGTYFYDYLSYPWGLMGYPWLWMIH